MRQMTIDVIIPTYKPGKQFVHLIERLQKQNHPIHCIRVIHTESEGFPKTICKAPYPIEITNIKSNEFDHGGTRNLGASMSDADIIVFMTQDAIPADDEMIGKLIEIFEKGIVDIAYARQLPCDNCSIVERYTRSFNYPAESRIKSEQDIEILGIKTFFCSNVCAAYRRAHFVNMGGFEERTIFNEDMIFAGHSILAGHKVAYVADAKVIHSHNYTAMQQFRRNFDLAVSQVEHPEIFTKVRSESEGLRLVKKTALYLLKHKKPCLLIPLFIQSASKYCGYKLGKCYQKLPKRMILICTMNPRYWSS